MFIKKIGLLDESRKKYRVWPLDCDFNLHLTNSRYFSLCDVSRFYYMGQVGALFKLLTRKWLPVAQAQEISYFRPINPFQQFEVLTRFTYWDDKYWYTEHRFFVGEKLCALVQVRGVFVHKRKVLSFNEVLAVVGQEAVVPKKPKTVEHWQKLIESKKGVQ
ncbi:MAG: thioesterase family protein [Gammaproteobacteria bacterium]|nr:thioesterase family protein [Gammaproteobacteria bacterium]